MGSDAIPRYLPRRHRGAGATQGAAARQSALNRYPGNTLAAVRKPGTANAGRRRKQCRQVASVAGLRALRSAAVRRALHTALQLHTASGIFPIGTLLVVGINLRSPIRISHRWPVILV